jgi:hypothetical protein
LLPARQADNFAAYSVYVRSFYFQVMQSKMEPQIVARSLVAKADWVNAICGCQDPAARRWALYACAKAVLPYWESRYQRDDSMQNLVDCMSMAASAPSIENDATLKAAIPKRERKRWDLSPPPGFFEEHYSTCPADFAGDSVFHAACAFINDPIDDHDDLSAFATAKECLARLFVERDANYDDNKNYQDIADDYLRQKMLEILVDA